MACKASSVQWVLGEEPCPKAAAAPGLQGDTDSVSVSAPASTSLRLTQLWWYSHDAYSNDIKGNLHCAFHCWETLRGRCPGLKYTKNSMPTNDSHAPTSAPLRGAHQGVCMTASPAHLGVMGTTHLQRHALPVRGHRWLARVGQKTKRLQQPQRAITMVTERR